MAKTSNTSFYASWVGYIWPVNNQPTRPDDPDDPQFLEDIQPAEGVVNLEDNFEG